MFLFLTVGDWIVPASRDSTKTDVSETEKSMQTDVSGDIEMAPIYVKHLLPQFVTVYQSSVLSSVRLCLL